MAISNSYYKDWAGAKKAIANNSKPVTVTLLKQNGEPSKAPTAVSHYATEAEAAEYIARIQKLNPGRNYQFRTTIR
jgi:hypothetical protein